MNKVNKKNVDRYNRIWQHSSVQKPNIWSSWETVKGFTGTRCLEIGCGNNPRIPLENSFFLDISKSAVANLKSAGLRAYLGAVENIPFQDNFFNLVVAWYVLEHVEDDKKAFSEISRALENGGYFLFAVPLWKEKFNEIDVAAGHKRRYEPKELIEILKENKFKILKYKSESGLLGILFRNPLFFPLMVKIYKRPEHINYFGLPKFIVNFLMRFSAFIERTTMSEWKEGQPKNLKEVGNIILFCQKQETTLG